MSVTRREVFKRLGAVLLGGGCAALMRAAIEREREVLENVRLSGPPVGPPRPRDATIRIGDRNGELFDVTEHTTFEGPDDLREITIDGQNWYVVDENGDLWEATAGSADFRPCEPIGRLPRLPNV